MSANNYIASASSVGPVLKIQQRLVKRLFDIILSIIGIATFWWLIVLAFIVASVNTRSNGFFLQERVGLYNQRFKIIKIRTMLARSTIKTTVTCSNDMRITKVGRVIRKLKIDELPQLLNIVIGDMSFVGPRPDVPGFADQLTGNEKAILSVRPGITGPATLKYRNEEEILSQQANPETYNRDVIFPDKVKINLDYIENWRLVEDIRYIWQTFIGRW